MDLGSKVQAGDILLVQHLDDARAEMLKAKARYAEAGANAATTDVSYSTSLTRYEADYKLAQVNAERTASCMRRALFPSLSWTVWSRRWLIKKAQYDALGRSRKAMMAHRRRSTVRSRLLPDVSRSTLLRKNKYHDLIFQGNHAQVLLPTAMQKWVAMRLQGAGCLPF